MRTARQEKLELLVLLIEVVYIDQGSLGSLMGVTPDLKKLIHA